MTHSPVAPSLRIPPRRFRAPRRMATPAVLVCVVLLGVGAPGSATALPRPASDDRYAQTVNCPLERVGEQFVRCDDLTGDGSPAPRWFPEQHHPWGPDR